MIDEIDFESDSFSDIMAKDSRYASRAYAILVDLIRVLSVDGKHMSSVDVLEGFKDLVLDQYGPMAFTVLREFGVNSCEDIGEMMFNLVESRRISKSDNDSRDDFITYGYDFHEAFLRPYTEQ